MTRTIQTACCIVGGGPAGMMLGFLLARAGVDVVVLEKHADFLRDFRGDTVHPSTLENFAELGLLDAFLRLPHEKVERLGAQFGDTYITMADFTHVPTRAKFIAFVPQWDLLNFLAEKGRRYPPFQLEMRAEVTELLEEAGRIVGVRAETPEGPLEVRARLVVGCDGRGSVVRDRAGLEVMDFGAPLDVLWFSMPKQPGEQARSMGRFKPGLIFIQINRGDYWQCAFVIPKGSSDAVHAAGLDAFRRKVGQIAPAFAGRVETLVSWDHVKLLTVKVDRLKHWYRDGLLCIGDAAHAMSPVGGVGINLAIQDAVATANILAGPLRDGALGTQHLAAVQKRREWPAKATQWVQIQAQKRVIAPTLSGKGSGEFEPPFAMRLFGRFPIVQRLPARLIGLGIRPEHVRTPDIGGASRAEKTAAQ